MGSSLKRTKPVANNNNSVYEQVSKYSEIIELIRKEDVTLFVGSGCSLESGAPSAAALADKIWGRLFVDNQDQDIRHSLPLLSEALILQENGSRKVINEIICDSFADLKPSEFHKNLRRIPHFHTIITTNYDDLIEKAYTFDYFQTICSDKELVTADGRKVQLLKIHGDLQHLENIIISRTDYRHFMETPQQPLLWSRVTNEFATKHIVFVGYSADDDNVLNLIDKVKQQVGDGVKKLFIICPNLKPTQRNRLRQLNITYVQGTGSEFVGCVIEDLKNTFGEDRYNNICSQDTLARFGLLSEVIFSFENTGEHTHITNWRGLNNPLSVNLHFETRHKDLFEEKAPVPFKEMIKGFSYPMYQLSPEESATFELRVNTLRVNGEKELQVYLGPSIDNVDVIFTTAESRIKCRGKAQKYIDKNICHICIPTSFFNMELTLDISTFNTGCSKGSLTATANERFNDLESAINWCSLLAAMQKGESTKLSIGSFGIENLSFTNDKGVIAFYHDWAEYCENLKWIERVGNMDFAYYDGFSPDALLCSRMIKSYLEKKAFIGPARNNLRDFKIDVEKGAFSKDGVYVVRICTKVQGPVELCGRDFPITEERVFLPRCRIESITSSLEDKDTLHLVNLENNIQYEYCNENDPDSLINPDMVQ